MPNARTINPALGVMSIAKFIAIGLGDFSDSSVG